jgi:hypothetical protein
MDTKEVKVSKIIEELRAGTKSLDDIFETYESRIRALKAQLQDAESQTNEAESKAKTANEKYQKAIDLKRGQYDQLIRDLFETPSENLERSIKNQSRRSTYITLAVALVSILISILITILSTAENSKSIESLLSRLDKIESKTDSMVTISKESQIKRLVDEITVSKYDFSNYRTQKDLSLAYKMRIGNQPDVTYEDFITAFKLAGLPQDVVPADEDTLSTWDYEFTELCRNALRTIREKDRSANVEEIDRKYATFKLKSDATDYDGWGFPDPSFTYSDLEKSYKGALDTFEKRMIPKSNKP